MDGEGEDGRGVNGEYEGHEVGGSRASRLLGRRKGREDEGEDRGKGDRKVTQGDAGGAVLSGRGCRRGGCSAGSSTCRRGFTPRGTGTGSLGSLTKPVLGRLWGACYHSEVRSRQVRVRSRRPRGVGGGGEGGEDGGVCIY